MTPQRGHRAGLYLPSPGIDPGDAERLDWIRPQGLESLPCPFPHQKMLSDGEGLGPKWSPIGKAVDFLRNKG